MFRWFETRIEAFPDEPPGRPPDTLLAFYALFHQAGVAGLRGAAGRGLPRLDHRGDAAGFRRQPRRHDEGRRDAPDLHGQPLGDPAVDGLHRAGCQAHRLHRPRSDQEPDHRRAGRQSRALADASLCPAPEPRLLPERFRRPRRQQGHAGGAGAARLRGAGDRCHLVCGGAVGRRGRHLRRRPTGACCCRWSYGSLPIWVRCSTSSRASSSARPRPPRRARCWSGAWSTATPTSSPSSSSPMPTARTAMRARRWRSRWPSGRPRCASRPPWSSCSIRSTAS